MSLGLLMAVPMVQGYSDGPPPAHTGADGQADCSDCHYAGPPPDDDSGLVIEGLPEQLRADEVYAFTVSLRAPEMRRAGVQMTLRGGEAELLDGKDGLAAQTHQDAIYLSHRQPREVDTESGAVSWRVNLAPGESPQGLRLYVSAVAGNDDDSSLGDTVYTSVFEIPPEARRSLSD